MAIKIKEELLYYKDNDGLIDVPWRYDENPWRDPYYAMLKTFSREEIASMTDETIYACFKIVDAVGSELYCRPSEPWVLY